MSYADYRPTPPTSSSGSWAWRVRHSAWILAPLLGCGFLSCIGFVYCAVRVREPRWIVLAAVSFVATVVGWILATAWTTASGEMTDGAAGYVIGLWLASLGLSGYVLPDYWRWRDVS